MARTTGLPRKWGLALLMTALLATQAAADVRTLSDGISKSGRHAQAGYSVRFEFAQLNGAYLAEVRVAVAGTSGEKVVDTVSAGPWLFADLAPGAYRITATAKNGAKQSAPFTVEAGAAQKAVRLVWR